MERLSDLAGVIASSNASDQISSDHNIVLLAHLVCSELHCLGQLQDREQLGYQPSVRSFGRYSFPSSAL